MKKLSMLLILKISCNSDFDLRNTDKYFLSITVNNSAEEISKLNDQLLQPITLIEEQLADLLIDDVRLTEVGSNSLRINFDVKNDGDGFAKFDTDTRQKQKSFYNYYLSKDAILNRNTDKRMNPSDISLLEVIYGDLSICKEATQTFRPDSFRVSNISLESPYLFIEIQCC